MKKIKIIEKDLKFRSSEEFSAQAMKPNGFHEAYDQEEVSRALARQIRETRTAKKLTQQAVAKKAAMPQSVIARLESGDHSVSVETLRRVAHALGKRVEIV